MLFRSPLFLFLFLPILLAVYFVPGASIPERDSPPGQPPFLHPGRRHLRPFVMLAIIAVSYVLGRLVQGRRRSALCHGSW